MSRKQKEPTGKNFRKTMIVGTVVGLGVAIVAFCLLQIISFRNLKNISEIIKMLVSVFSGLIGVLTSWVVIIMGYRREKRAEKQAESDRQRAEQQAEEERLRAEEQATFNRCVQRRERLRKAHDDLLNKSDVNSCLCAIGDLKQLLKESSDDSEEIARYLSKYLKSYQPPDAELGEEDLDLPTDYEAAAETLASALRRIIETNAKEERTHNPIRPSEGPPKDIIKDAKMLYEFAEIYVRTRYEFFQWQNLQADGMNLEKIKLRHAMLDNAHLSGAHLEGTDFTSASLKDANLQNAHLERASFASAYLEGAVLCKAHLDKETDFTMACLRHANFQNTHLKGAYLDRADLRYAHLEGADLRDAHLEGVLFLEEAHIDKDTKFDPGIRMQYFGEEEPEHKGD